MSEHPSPQAQEFHGDSVQFKVHYKPNCLVEFEVKAAASVVQEAQKQALRAVAKEVSLPGFRKGRAPDVLVLKKYPADIDRKWQDFIANIAFQQCQKNSPVSPLNRDTQISYKMKSHNHESADLSLSFEVAPQVPVIDPSNFTFSPIPEIDVTQEKVEEVLRQILYFFATWQAIDDRPAQTEDLVILDVEDMEEDPPKKLFSHVRFEVSNKGMAKWMRDLVLGMRTGDVAEGVSYADEEATEEEKATFKPKKVRIHLKTIEQATLPELDDALARQVGTDDVATLRENIQALLTKQATQHKREKIRDQVSTYLLENYRFDLPHSLVRKEAQYRMQQLMADENFKTQWDGMQKQERDELISSLLILSEKAVRLFYISQKIIHEQNLSVSPEDLHQTPITPVEVLLNPQAALAAPGRSEMQQSEVYSRVLLEKAEDYIIAHSKK